MFAVLGLLSADAPIGAVLLVLAMVVRYLRKRLG